MISGGQDLPGNALSIAGWNRYFGEELSRGMLVVERSEIR